MKNTIPPFAIAALAIGILNPILLFALLFRSPEIVQAILTLGLPMVGIVSGLFGLISPGGVGRLLSGIGVVMNLLPIGFLILVIVAFSDGNFSPLWK